MGTNIVKERIWEGLAAQRYPKKWIVMVNCGWDPNGKTRMLGELYKVFDEQDEAYDLAINLDKQGSRAMVVEGVPTEPSEISSIFRSDPW